MAALSAEAWTALATWGTFVVLVVSAAIAARQVREQFRPWVTVDFHFRSIFAMVAIKNLGNRPAYEIQIRFEPDLVSTLVTEKELAEIAMFREPIPILVPGEERMVLFERVPNRLKADELPTQHHVFVSDRDHRGRQLGPHEFILDFAHLYGGTLPDRNLHDLVGEVEKLRKAVGK